MKPNEQSKGHHKMNVRGPRSGGKDPYLPISWRQLISPGRKGSTIFIPDEERSTLAIKLLC